MDGVIDLNTNQDGPRVRQITTPAARLRLLIQIQPTSSLFSVQQISREQV